MLWIALLIFLVVVVAVVGGYFLLAAPGVERAEIKKRLSLLELRNLQTNDLPQVLKNELLSEVPTLNKILSRLDAAVRIDRRLRQADLRMKVGTFILLSLTMGVLGIAAGALLRWPHAVSLAAGGLLFVVPNTVVNVKKRLRLKRFLNHFPDALEMFARSLRAGHSFTGA
ncbi:MAG: type II secretion system F family protein, partial [Deltaproteobacteria bacterium]